MGDEIRDPTWAKVPWDAIVPLLVWQFLIPQAAGWAQTVLYSIFVRAGDPKPQPGSLTFIKHRRHILLTIYAAYFVFTVYEVDSNLQRLDNAYNVLGVPIDVDEATLNSRFRRITLKYHPDKAGPDVDWHRANEYYTSLRIKRDMILDPVRRFAHDRFGPGIFTTCPDCLTVDHYIAIGWVSEGLAYGTLLIGLIGANALGFLRDGWYWRYLGLLAVATFQMRTIVRPDHPTFLVKYLNPFLTLTGIRPAYLPFQIIKMVQRASMSFAQFLSFLVPLYRIDPWHPTVSSDEDTDATRHKQLDRLSTFVAESNKDATRLLELESIPYRENEKAKREMREALKKYMVQNVVHQEKDVRNALGQSMARRRWGVPHGAQGTR